LGVHYAKIPAYTILSSTEEFEKIVVNVSAATFRANWRDLLQALFSVESGDCVKWRFLSGDERRSTLIAVVKSDCASKVHDKLSELARSKGIEIDVQRIPPVGRILPTIGVPLSDENDEPVRVIPFKVYVGTFICIYKTLGEGQGDFVVERIGFYYGHEFADFLVKRGVVRRGDAVKTVLYSLVTGASMGLYRVADVKHRALQDYTSLEIRLRDYYEERLYAEAGLRKCGNFEIGFFKGILHYHASGRSYSVEETQCYFEGGVSVFSLKAPGRLGSEEAELLRGIRRLSGL